MLSCLNVCVSVNYKKYQKDSWFIYITQRIIQLDFWEFSY